MDYTSGQYKYILVRLLQRMVSMGNNYDRAYTYDFFYKLLDSSIIVNEESFNGFIHAMDVNAVALAKRNESYYSKNLQGYIGSGEPGEGFLVEAFKAIGIELKFNDDIATFTKPDGSVMKYVAGTREYGVTGSRLITSNGGNSFYLNVHSYQEYEYAKKSSIAFSLKNIDVLDIEELPPNVCGIETYWKYNGERQEQTIIGNGIFAGVTDDSQLGAGKYKTIIFSASIKEIQNGSVWTKGDSYKDGDSTKYYPGNCIFLHSANENIKISEEFCKSNYKTSDWSSLTVYPQIVYTDCKKIIDELTGLDYITLKPLSDWNG